jgi:hypothetical protein
MVTQGNAVLQVVCRSLKCNLFPLIPVYSFIRILLFVGPKERTCFVGELGLLYTVHTR